jgi:hypothetical protein
VEGLDICETVFRYALVQFVEVIKSYMREDRGFDSRLITDVFHKALASTQSLPELSTR